MLNLLRSNQLLVVPIVVIYAVLLHLHRIVFPREVIVLQSEFLSGLLFQNIDSSGLVAKILAIVLIVIQALLVNTLANKNKIAKPFSYFPAGFYVLISGFIYDLGTLSPVLLGNTFFILALIELYKVYKKNHIFGNVFNVGFWLSVASLFYFSMNIFFILGLIGLLTLRSFKVKEWLIYLIGFLVPYFLAATYCFWMDKLGLFFQFQFANNFGFLSFDIPSDWQFMVRMIVFGLLVLVVLLSSQRYFNKRTIQSQKYINLLFMAMFIGSLTVLIQANISLPHLLILSAPVAILISMTFLSMKRKVLAEIFFLILFLLALYLQYSGFFSRIT